MNVSEWPLTGVWDVYVKDGPISRADLAALFNVNVNLGRFIMYTLIIMGLIQCESHGLLRPVAPTQHQVGAFMTALRTRMVRDVDERLGGGSGAQVFSVEDRLK